MGPAITFCEKPTNAKQNAATNTIVFFILSSLFVCGGLVKTTTRNGYLGFNKATIVPLSVPNE